MGDVGETSHVVIESEITESFDNQLVCKLRMCESH